MNVRGDIKIQVAATATVCSCLLKVTTLLGQFKQSNIDINPLNLALQIYKFHNIITGNKGELLGGQLPGEKTYSFIR